MANKTFVERVSSVIKENCRKYGVMPSSQLIGDLSAQKIAKMVEEMLFSKPFLGNWGNVDVAIKDEISRRLKGGL